MRRVSLALGNRGLSSVVLASVLVLGSVLALTHAQGPYPNIPTVPSVAFDSSSYTVGEGGTLTVTASLSAISASDVTVTWQVSTTDYNGNPLVYSGNLVFTAGTTSQTMSLEIEDDSCCQGNVTLSAALTNPVNASLGSPSTATVTVLDDDTCP